MRSTTEYCLILTATGSFNPNNTSGKDVTLSRSDAAPGVTGSALLADLSGVTGTVNVGLEGAVGSGSGLTLTDGKMYKLRFRYYAENVVLTASA